MSDAKFLRDMVGGHEGPTTGRVRMIAANIDRLKEVNADLFAALTTALAYLDRRRPKGKTSDIFSELNEYENAVMKPGRDAIAKAKGVVE